MSEKIEKMMDLLEGDCADVRLTKDTYNAIIGEENISYEDLTIIALNIGDDEMFGYIGDDMSVGDVVKEGTKSYEYLQKIKDAGFEGYKSFLETGKWD